MTGAAVLKHHADLPQQGCQPHLAELVELIRVELRAGIEHAVRAGALLIDAKRVVDHGHWLPWLRENFGLSERSAQNYMKLSRDVAALPAANAKRVALLPLREALASIAESRTDLHPATGKQTQTAAPKPLAKITKKTDTPVREIEDHDHAGGEDHGEDNAQPEPKRLKRHSRAQLWGDAVERAIAALEDLIGIQNEYQQWRDSLPDNLGGSTVAEKLNAVIEIDLQGALDTVNEAQNADLPLGFGRD